MRYAVSPTVMIESDRQTIVSGTPAVTLLDRAGHALCNAHTPHTKVGIVCGTGNNGRDA